MSTIDLCEDLTNQLREAVVALDEVRVKSLCESIIAQGVDPHFAVKHGLMAAMEKVAELYSSEVYYVSELLLGADALQTGLQILAPHVAADQLERGKRQMIIGTVEGDIHDVGKNVVKVMFEATGWVVHDLGKDVAPRRFIEEQSRLQADIIALSALMSTTMLAIPKTIQAVKAVHPHVPILVGGAPLTRDIALTYGADGYAPNAGEATAEAKAVLVRTRKE